MIKKCEGWPDVLPDDDGIRPGGESDECFYCGRKVGQPHQHTCICVSSLTKWGVYLIPASGERRKVGTMEDYKPYGRELRQWEFHLNESSWCADNAWDTDGSGMIKWTDGRVPQELLERGDDTCCSCSLLEFEFEGIVDIGPFITVREKT